MIRTRRVFLQKMGIGALAFSLTPFARFGQGQIELTFWNSPFSDPIIARDYVSWFQQRLRETLPGNVSVSFATFGYSDLQRQFLIQARTGRPDAIEGVPEHIPIYQSAGLIAPLTARFRAWSEHLEFLPMSLEPLTFKGELWAVPYMMNARALLARRSLLEKYGRDAPKTWAALLEIAAQITAGEREEISGYIISSRRGAVRVFQEFLSHVYQICGRLFVYNPAERRWELQCSAEQITQIFQFYHDLFHARTPSAIPTQLRGKTGLEVDTGYTLGLHALAPTGPFVFVRRREGELQRQILERDTLIEPLPLPPQGQPKTLFEAKPVMLNAFSRHPELAFIVIQVFTSAESIARMQYLVGDLAPRQDVTRFYTPLQFDERLLTWLRRWQGILPSGVAPEPLDWTPVQGDLYDLVENVIFRRMTPAEAGQRLHARLKEMATRAGP